MSAAARCPALALRAPDGAARRSGRGGHAALQRVPGALRTPQGAAAAAAPGAPR